MNRCSSKNSAIFTCDKNIFSKLARDSKRCDISIREGSTDENPIPFRANWYPTRLGNARKKAAVVSRRSKRFWRAARVTFYQKTGLFSLRRPGIQFFGARNEEASSADRTPIVVSRAKNRRSTSSNSLNTG